jgi:hypothetical protein
MNELTQSIAGLVTTRDVYDYCALSIPDELIDGAIRDFAESLAYAAEGEYSPADAGEYVEDVSDRWRSEFAPSWTIYTGESEEVIARIGLSEVMDAHRDAFGYPAEDVAQLIGFVADDLTGSVVAAFENVDWSELEDDEDD